MLQLDRTAHSRQWITFIATDLVDDAVNNNRNQLKVQVVIVFRLRLIN